MIRTAESNRRADAAGTISGIAMAAGAMLLVGACASTPRFPSADTVGVVVTTTQLADFTREVGGTHVTVYSVARPGIDPHDQEPAPIDLDRMARASLVVVNGAGIDRWAGTARSQSGGHARLITASDGVTIVDGDPHVWFDPRNAVIMVRNIAEALVAVDPGHADDFRSAAAAYTDQITGLDSEIARDLATVSSPELVTNHDAFGYYVRRYGLTFVGSIIPSFDSQAELSLSRSADLVRRIRDLGVKAVFAESSLPTRLARAIATEAGVKVVDQSGALYGDALGPPGSDGDTYLKMMRHNTETIVTNLR